MWKWKDLVLTGVFSERRLYYIGRNQPLIGLLVALNFMANSKKSKKVFLCSLAMLLVYVAFAFANPRREPIIEKLIYIVIPFVLAYKGRIWRLSIFLIPIAVVFALLFITLNKQLTFGQESLARSLGSYTFGPFCALSKALDVGYPSNTNLPYGNSLYFVYSILKYISPNLTPPEIVLNNLDSNSVNVYTCLIAPIIDSDGDQAVMVFNIILYAFLVGFIISFVVSMHNKRNNISSLFLLCSCVSSALRSFFNPTFSYLEFLPALFVAFVLSFVFGENFIVDFRIKKKTPFSNKMLLVNEKKKLL